MAALFLPEFLKLVALGYFKSVGFILDRQFGGCQLIDEFFLESQLWKGQITFLWVSSGVDQFKSWVLFLNSAFDLFPINLEAFINILRLEVNN